MSRKKYGDDDGRQIVDMSVTERSLYGDPFLGGFKRKPQKTEESASALTVPALDKKETRRMIFFALKMSLLIGLIFVAGGLLFILFCQYIWLR